MTNVQPIVRNDAFVRTDKPVAVGWNLVMGKASDWPVTFDASYSKVTREDFNVEFRTQFFNLFNRQNPAAVETTTTNANLKFGALKQVLPGREGQFGVRLEF